MKKTKKYFLLLTPLFIAAILLSGCTLEQKAVQQLSSIGEEPEFSTEEGTTPPAEEKTIKEPTSKEDSTEVLDLSNQGLTEFPRDILSRTKLKKLILSKNSLRTLPSEIGELVNIEELYLDNNLLEGALVAEIRKMPRLRILDASNNNMTGIPAEIGQLSNLVTLDYSGNRIDTMPNEIENLSSNLKTLDLTNNAYSPEMLKQIEEKLPNTQVIY